MRCFICDANLSPEEIHYNTKYEGQKYGPYDPCRRCLSEIDEAFEDPLNEEEIDFLMEDEEPVELDEDFPWQKWKSGV